MYDIGHGPFDFALEPGTNVLVTGPPLCGKRRFGMRALATGSRRGEDALVVTTRDTADRVRSDYRVLFTGENRAEPTLRVVDAVSETIGHSVAGDCDTKFASSPSDTSGIGRKFAEFVRSHYTAQGIERTRVLVDSLSPLLVYSTLQSVFRFVHVFTSRVDNADAVGFYTLTATAHDDETIAALTNLFDGTVELTGDGTATVRLPNRETRTVDL